MKTTLELKAIEFSPILSSVTVTLGGGRVVGLVGPNGAGKSTLLRTVAGLLPKTAGEVWVDSTRIDPLPVRKRAQQIAYLPQHLASDIPFTVREYVEMGRFSHRALWATPHGHSDIHDVLAAIARMGLEKYVDTPLMHLSGGEQQRAGIARCLAQESPVLLLDEPISNLDVYYQLDILTQLRRLAERGHLVVIAIHHLEFALRFCDELLVLNRGTVYAHGEAQQVFTREMVRDVFGIDASLFLDPVTHHPRISMSAMVGDEVAFQE